MLRRATERDLMGDGSGSAVLMSSRSLKPAAEISRAAAAIAPLALSAGMIGAGHALRLIYVAIVFSVLLSLGTLQFREAKGKVKEREKRKKRREEQKKVEELAVKKGSITI